MSAVIQPAKHSGHSGNSRPAMPRNGVGSIISLRYLRLKLNYVNCRKYVEMRLYILAAVEIPVDNVKNSRENAGFPPLPV